MKIKPDTNLLITVDRYNKTLIPHLQDKKLEDIITHFQHNPFNPTIDYIEENIDVAKDEILKYKTYVFDNNKDFFKVAKTKKEITTHFCQKAIEYKKGSGKKIRFSLDNFDCKLMKNGDYTTEELKYIYKNYPELKYIVIFYRRSGVATPPWREETEIDKFQGCKKKFENLTGHFEQSSNSKNSKHSLLTPKKTLFKGDEETFEESIVKAPPKGITFGKEEKKFGSSSKNSKPSFPDPKKPPFKGDDQFIFKNPK